MKEMTIDAAAENIGTVTAFVDEQLEAVGCPMKAQMQIDIAIDELMSNIAHYAYHPGVGEVTVRVEFLKAAQGVEITFIDSGVPFNPLDADHPDTGLSAEARSIGGLGIFMVKKSMDEMTYRREDGKNILSIQKRIGG